MSIISYKIKGKNVIDIQKAGKFFKIMNLMNKKDSQIKKKYEFIMLILQNVNVKIIESYT